MEKEPRFFNILVLSLILITVSTLVFPLIEQVRFQYRADEGWYLAYADFVADKGLSGFRRLFTGYTENENRWIHPNPLRIFYISVASMFVRLFGNTFFSLAYLSLLSFLLFIAFIYYFCHKFYGREKAIFLTLLVSFSPINMGMSRRALLDSVLALFLGISIWLFLYIVHKDRRITTRWLFSVLFSLTILTRETSLLLVVPFVIYMIIYKTRHGEDVKLSDFRYIAIYPLAIVGIAYLFVSGGIYNLISMARVIFTKIILRTMSDPYARTYGAGPWFRYLIDFMLLSPWTVILFIGYTFYVVRNPSSNNIQDIYFLIIFLSVLVFFNFLTKNVRYVMILDLPIRLFSVLMLYKLIRFKEKSLRFIVIGGMVLLICVTDLLTFYDMFVTKHLYDPMSMWLLGFREIIPLQ